ncbi:MAG: lipopolysaccharide assembly protein LapA domain-containing protein [Alphaproteobacteria bacterium]
MRALSSLLTIVIAAIVVWFAIANRHIVPLTFDPLPLSIELPFFLPILIAVLLGLLAGGLISLRAAGERRARLRRAERQRDELQQNLDTVRDKGPAGTSPTTLGRSG